MESQDDNKKWPESNYRELLNRLTPKEFTELYQQIPPYKSTLVLTSNYNQFRQWCIDNGVPKNSRSVKWLNGFRDIFEFDAHWKIEMPQAPELLERAIGLNQMGDIYEHTQTIGIEWVFDRERETMKSYLDWRIDQIQKEREVLDHANRIFIYRPRERW